MADADRERAMEAETPPVTTTRAQLRRARQAEMARLDPVPPATLPSRRSLRAASQPEPLQVIPDAVVAASDDTSVAAVPATFAAAAASDCLEDEFDRAARLLQFTGELPARQIMAAQAPALRGHTHVVPRRRTGAIVARVAAASLSVAAMGIVGMLALGTTGPAALAASEATADIRTDITATGSDADEEIQAYVSSSDAQTIDLNRSDSFNVTSISELAAQAGVTQFANTWINNPNAAVQWPFAVGVPISAAYGSSSYLATFSSAHRGVDLTPGAGAEIHVIADGTVRIATESGGDYGVTVVVDHVIDGELVSTRYAHMQYGSLQVSPGDTVSVGDVLGTVGETGKATGPHLHFEVLLGGTAYTDPMAWMYEHAGS